jgi:hypothetical protein
MKTKLTLLIVISFLMNCSHKIQIVQSDITVESYSVVGTLNNPEINEASGLATSFNNPGKFWTHNDSGDKARIFLIDSVGNSIATVYLKNIINRDWEDIATGPGSENGVNYIYIAEIGDNNAAYVYKNIYRIAEPTISGFADSLIVSKVDAITFIYPDGRRDAETLMVDPVTKDLFVVSKRESMINVYRAAFPQSTTDTLTLENVGTLPITSATSGDISANGNNILIKNYNAVYYWGRQKGETIADALKRKPIQLPYEVEPQGESIAWAKNGLCYYTLSEEGDQKVRPKLYKYLLKRLSKKN